MLDLEPFSIFSASRPGVATHELYDVFCGGPGSGVPGPCPENRAEATASAKMSVAEAEKVLSKGYVSPKLALAEEAWLQRRDGETMRRLLREAKQEAVDAYNALPGEAIHLGVGSPMLSVAKGEVFRQAKQLSDGQWAYKDDTHAGPISESQVAAESQSGLDRARTESLAEHFTPSHDELKRIIVLPPDAMDSEEDSDASLLMPAGAREIGKGYFVLPAGTDPRKVLGKMKKYGVSVDSITRQDTLESMYRSLDVPERHYQLDQGKPAVGRKINDAWTILYDPHRGGEAGFVLSPTASVEAREARMAARRSTQQQFSAENGEPFSVFCGGVGGQPVPCAGGHTPHSIHAELTALHARADVQPHEVETVKGKIRNLSGEHLKTLMGLRRLTGAGSKETLAQRMTRGIRTTMPATSSPAKTLTTSPHDAASHVPTLASAIRRLDASGYNTVPLHAVRPELEKAGVVEREHQDSVIKAARRAGVVTLQAHEGRHGTTPQEKDAMLRERDGDEVRQYSHIGLRHDAMDFSAGADGLWTVFCGGPGSGRPGPCPKGVDKAHIVARAHANAAAHAARKAEGRAAKLAARVAKKSTATVSSKVERKTSTKTIASEVVPHAASALVLSAVATSPGLSDEQRKQYGENASRVLGTMPKAALDRIGQNLAKAQFHADCKSIGLASVEDMEAVPGLSEKQKEELKLIREAVESGALQPGGSYGHLNGGVLHVDGDFEYSRMMHGKYTTGEGATASQVYAHELGHAVDGPKLEYSSSPEWTQAFVAEIQGSQFGYRNESPLSEYAATKTSEGFAEFSRLLYGSQVSTARIASDFPKCAAFFRDKGLWPAERTGSDTGVQELFEKRVSLVSDDRVSHIDALKQSQERVAPQPHDERADLEKAAVARGHDMDAVDQMTDDELRQAVGFSVDLVEPFSIFCGGPGSGVPGPCPKAADKAHIVARAHANAAAHAARKAETHAAGAKKTVAPKATVTKPVPAVKKAVVPKAAPKVKAEPAHTVDSVHAEYQSLKARGGTSEQVAALATKMGSLTLPKLKELQGKIGVKASGVKAAQVAKLSTSALAVAGVVVPDKVAASKIAIGKASASIAPKPPKPHFTGIDPNGHQWVDGVQVARDKPDPKYDGPGGVAMALQDAYNQGTRYTDGRDGVVTLQVLHNEASKLIPGLTPKQMHDELQKLWNTRHLELKILNEVRDLSPEAMKTAYTPPPSKYSNADYVYNFVYWKKPLADKAEAAKAGATGSATPAQPVRTATPPTKTASRTEIPATKPANISAAVAAAKSPQSAVVRQGTFGPSTATIRDEAKANKIAESVLGPGKTARDVASLAGALPGSTVTIEGLRKVGGGMAMTVLFEGTHAYTDSNGKKVTEQHEGERAIIRDKNGNVKIVNESFAGKGAGLEMFGRQVENATLHGVTHIETYAAGDARENAEEAAKGRVNEDAGNGYYTWPRFGYEGAMSESQKSALPSDLRKDVDAAKGDIRGLMATKAGRDYWKANGDSLKATFSLAPGSYSQRTLAAYLAGRGKTEA